MLKVQLLSTLTNEQFQSLSAMRERLSWSEQYAAAERQRARHDERRAIKNRRAKQSQSTTVERRGGDGRRQDDVANVAAKTRGDS